MASGPNGQRPPARGSAHPVRSPTAREARQGWAALIKPVYEADPLRCPQCGAQLKILAFIKRHQTDVIETILPPCGLWDEPSARAPRKPEIPIKG